LASKIWNIMELGKPFKVKFVSGFKYDIRKRIPDVQKVKKLINWQARVNFDNGLKEVINWLAQQKAAGKLDFPQKKLAN